MEEPGNLYDVFGTMSLWDAPQHECLDNVDNVESLRRRIKYYFMNPCEKYHARGRKPWKLMLQIIKIAIITIQVVLSGVTEMCIDSCVLLPFCWQCHPPHPHPYPPYVSVGVFRAEQPDGGQI